MQTQLFSCSLAVRIADKNYFRYDLHVIADADADQNCFGVVATLNLDRQYTAYPQEQPPPRLRLKSLNHSQPLSRQGCFIRWVSCLGLVHPELSFCGPVSSIMCKWTRPFWGTDCRRAPKSLSSDQAAPLCSAGIERARKGLQG